MSTLPPIPPTDADSTAASDPRTEAVVLARIAATRSDLHVVLARNPSTYPELVEWLGHSLDPAVLRALRERAESTGVAPSDAAQELPRATAQVTSECTVSPAGIPSEPMMSMTARASSIHESEPSHDPNPSRTTSARSGSAGGYVALGILILATLGGITYAIHDANTPGEASDEATPLASIPATPDSSPSATDVEISTPSATPTITGSLPVGSSTWTVKSAAGYTESIEVSVSEPVTGQQLDGVAIGGGIQDSPTYLNDVCSVDSTTDAVIPVEVVVTNTTSGFDTYMSYGITARIDESAGYQPPTSLTTDARFEVANTYKDGDTACNPLLSTGVNAFWSSTFTTGNTVQDTFYVIVRDYRTPARPEGDTQVLSLVHLVPMDSTADAGDETDYYTAQSPFTSLALDGTPADE